MANIKVLLPQWGMGMSEGKIVKWLKAVGDSVAEDEPLAEIEAEKTTETLRISGNWCSHRNFARCRFRCRSTYTDRRHQNFLKKGLEQCLGPIHAN